MQSWNLLELEMAEGSRSPIVLHSHDEARAVLIGLNPGQALGDHQVHENAWLVVVDGQVELHRVASRRGARILLLLAPWPGAGHYRGSASL